MYTLILSPAKLYRIAGKFKILALTKSAHAVIISISLKNFVSQIGGFMPEAYLLLVAYHSIATIDAN